MFLCSTNSGRFISDQTVSGRQAEGYKGEIVVPTTTIRRLIRINYSTTTQSTRSNGGFTKEERQTQEKIRPISKRYDIVHILCIFLCSCLVFFGIAHPIQPLYRHDIVFIISYIVTFPGSWRHKNLCRKSMGLGLYWSSLLDEFDVQLKGDEV
ncbi:hypothetical protein DINM_007061 [Dirofilaria immitis]|nr:hypothetical protein [Dirofilaria immitis]